MEIAPRKWCPSPGRHVKLGRASKAKFTFPEEPRILKFLIAETKSDGRSDLSIIFRKVSFGSSPDITIFELYSSPLSLVVGGDSFFKLHTWRSYQDLLGLVSLKVFRRDCHNEKEYQDYIETVLDTIDVDIDFYDLSHFSTLSSTDIRQRLETKSSFYDLVPQEVSDYIIRNDLYQ